MIDAVIAGAITAVILAAVFGTELAIKSHLLKQDQKREQELRAKAPWQEIAFEQAEIRLAKERDEFKERCRK